MIENVRKFSRKNDKVVEQIIDQDVVMINHMILPKGEALPEHKANSNVFMTTVKGKVTLKLNDQNPQVYDSGHILEIPYNTLMNVSNQHDELLELFVVKAPGPKAYGR